MKGKKKWCLRVLEISLMLFVALFFMANSIQAQGWRDFLTAPTTPVLKPDNCVVIYSLSHQSPHSWIPWIPLYYSPAYTYSEENDDRASFSTNSPAANFYYSPPSIAEMFLSPGEIIFQSARQSAIAAIANQPPGERGSWTDNNPTIINYDGVTMTGSYDPYAVLNMPITTLGY